MGPLALTTLSVALLRATAPVTASWSWKPLPLPGAVPLSCTRKADPGWNVTLLPPTAASPAGRTPGCPLGSGVARPGDTAPPALTERRTLPVPARVPPELTETGLLLAAIEPVTSRVPALTATAPGRGLGPGRVKTPQTALMRLPAWVIPPGNVVEKLLPPVVSVPLPSRTVPPAAPASEPIVSAKPFRSRTAGEVSTTGLGSEIELPPDRTKAPPP